MRTACAAFWFSSAVVILMPLSVAAEADGASEGGKGVRVISGHVVDMAGKPVPNAEVFCSPHTVTAFIPSSKQFATITARSGRDGQFVIQAPPADKYDVHPDHLWAYSPGYSVAVSAVPATDGALSPVRLILGPPTTFRIAVFQPDGTPARNASVLPSAIKIETEARNVVEGRSFPVPQALAALTLGKTDASGVAALSAWRYQDMLRVTIVTADYGRQQCYNRWPSDPLKADWGRRSTWNVALMSVGELHGRMMMGDGQPVQNRRLFVKDTSLVQDYSFCVLHELLLGVPIKKSFVTSEAMVVTDTDGRFTIPSIGHGWVHIALDDALNTPYYFPEVGQYGEETPPHFDGDDSENVTFRLHKSVHVQGTLRLNGTNMRPSQFRIACGKSYDGCSVSRAAFVVDVDDAGRFELYAAPGEMWLAPRAKDEAPLDYLRRTRFFVPLNGLHL